MFEVLVGFLVGSIATGWIVWGYAGKVATEATINVLADQGYIRYTRRDNGEIQIYLLDEKMPDEI